MLKEWNIILEPLQENNRRRGGVMKLRLLDVDRVCSGNSERHEKSVSARC